MTIITGTNHLLAQSGRMKVRLASGETEMTLDLSDAAAEELAQFLVGALKDIKTPGYNPEVGTITDKATAIRIDSETKFSSLGLEERFILTMNSQGATKVTFPISEDAVDDLIARAQSHPKRKYGGRKH